MPSSLDQAQIERSTHATKNHGRWQGWLIIGLLAGGMLMAYLLFPHSEEDRLQLLQLLGTSNKGDLVLPPRELQNIDLTQVGGEVWDLSKQKPLWRFLLPVNETCSEPCQKLLYLARQVHTRLAEKSPRVEKLLVNVGHSLEEGFSAQLKQEYPGVTLLRAEQEALSSLLGDNHVNWGSRLYVVDQAGFVMMSYGVEHSGGDLLKDIKRLLKYSREVKATTEQGRQ